MSRLSGWLDAGDVVVLVGLLLVTVGTWQVFGLWVGVLVLGVLLLTGVIVPAVAAWWRPGPPEGE